MAESSKKKASHKGDGGLSIVRVKPMNAGGGGVERSGEGLADGEGALRFGAADQRGIEVQGVRGFKAFKYANTIAPDVDNAALFAGYMPARIDAFFDGINCNVCAYGQTGTGKTHTMFGPPGIMERAGRGDYGVAVDAGYGIFPRALLAIFARARALGEKCVLTCSAIELSMIAGNRCMFDTGRKKSAQGLCSPECYGVTVDKSAKPPRVYGQSEVVLERESDLLRVFSALATRNTAGTGMNDSSSRTHCFAFLKLYVTEDGGETVRCSRFQFVDLAGSERMKEAHGSSDFRDTIDAFAGMCTNYALTMLSAAVRAYVEQRARERKKKSKPKAFSFRTYLFDLVLLLSESMTGRALTAVIVCVSQAPKNASQSSNALDFGKAFAKLDVRQAPVKAVARAKWAKNLEKQRAEAEKVLKGGVSAKFMNVRKAQKLDAEQVLDVLRRLGGGGGDAKLPRAAGPRA